MTCLHSVPCYLIFTNKKRDTDVTKSYYLQNVLVTEVAACPRFWHRQHKSRVRLQSTHSLHVGVIGRSELSRTKARLVAGFPPRLPGSGQLEILVDKMALRQVFSEYFSFSCQSSFYQILHHQNHSGQVQ
jgi:hypothetical protein